MTADELARGAALLAAEQTLAGATAADDEANDYALENWLWQHRAELLADAGRYQWLRNECISGDENDSPAALIEHCWVDAKIRTARDVDAAIDAARASGADEP